MAFQTTETAEINEPKLDQGSNIAGLAGCGIMGLKIEAGCGIRKILRPGYGMNISWWDWDALISIDWMRDSSEIVGVMRDAAYK